MSDGGDDWTSEDEICDKDEVSKGTIRLEREAIVEDWENDKDGARDGDDWTSEDGVDKAGETEPFDSAEDEGDDETTKDSEKD